MKDEWQTKDFGECAVLVRETVSPLDIGDAPYIGLEHIEVGTLSLLGHGVASNVTSTKSRFQRGDILFGKLRPYFRKAVRTSFDGICSTDIWVIRAKEGVDQGFLYYCIASWPFVDFANAGSEGTRMPRAKWEYVSRYKILLPSLSEQRVIAHILGTLDDKIELNRRMNETLEEMARAVFKSWFVDFDPVRAKMDGSWRRGESLPGMPAEMYDLFPSRLVDSELGEIPEGWGVGIVGDCFHLTMGQSPPGRTYNDEGDGLPFFQGCSDFGFRYPTNRRFCTAPTRIAESEDTLVSVRAPVGDINKAWERCCIGRGLAALQHKSGSPSFTYYLVWAIQQEIQQYEHTGTVFGAINKKQFKALKTVEPKLAAVDLFETFVLPLDERIRLNVSESRTLSGLRDTLLPKLISGELRVRNAEGFVEGTA